MRQFQSCKQLDSSLVTCLCNRSSKVCPQQLCNGRCLVTPLTLMCFVFSGLFVIWAQISFFLAHANETPGLTQLWSIGSIIKVLIFFTVHYENMILRSEVCGRYRQRLFSVNGNMQVE